MPKPHQKGSSSARARKVRGKVQFKNIATISDRGPDNPKLGNPRPGVTPSPATMTPAKGQQQQPDYFRDPIQQGTDLNLSPQPSITPDRVTQSVRMRFNPLRGLTPEKVVNNLEQWRLGFFRNAGMMFDVMERRDYQIQIVAPKRKKSVARHGYDVTRVAEVPDGMEQMADDQQDFLDNFWSRMSATTALDPDEEGGFLLLARQMMDAVGKHYAVHEIVYQPQADGSLTAKFIFCPIWWFEGTRGKLRFLDSEFQVYGRDMDPGEWLVTIHDGIMEACSLLFLFKWQALKAWSIFLDKFGQPGVQGLTDAQFGSPEWEQFKTAVSEFSEEYATVTNRSCEIKLIEAAQSGGANGLFDAMTQHMDKALTMLWRGGDLGTKSSMHGQGTGASLQKDETEILETDDAKIIEETLRKKVEKYALAWKFGADAPVLAQITLRTAPEKATDNDLKIDEFLLGNGCDLDKAELYERYGRNAPDTDAKPEDIVKATTPQDEATKLANETKLNGGGAPGFANAYAGAKVPDKIVKHFAGALADDLQPLRNALAAIEQISDPALFEKKLQEFIADGGPLVKLLADINAYPKSAKVINDTSTESMAAALGEKPKLTK